MKKIERTISYDNEILSGAIKRLYERFLESFDERMFDIYVTPQGGQLQVTDEQFDVIKAVKEFVYNPQQLSLLVLGDSGLGKTLLSLYLAKQYWQIANTKQSENWLPVWIWLPAITGGGARETMLLETHFSQVGLLKKEIEAIQLACQQGHYTPLIFLDGMDEIPIPKNSFYRTNGWWKTWHQLKVVTTCRPEAFAYYGQEFNYQYLFYPKEDSSIGFVEWYLQPFTIKQVEEYLQNYVNQSTSSDDTHSFGMLSVTKSQIEESIEEKFLPTQKKLIEITAKPNWSDWRTYQHYLTGIQPLAELAKNPFILSILVQCLPIIIAKQTSQIELQRFTREQIYQVFVENWLARQAKRLWHDSEKQKQLYELGSEEGLKACLLTYSENLARLALNWGKGKLDVILTEEVTLQPELLLGQSHQKSYFQVKPVPKSTIKLIRSGCLLKCQGATYRFLHKSIVEYFAARAMFVGAQVAVDTYLQGSLQLEHVFQAFGLNEHLLLNEPQIIEMLADKTQSDSNFKKLLYDIVEFSKQEPLVETAAANAITILKVSGESFSNKNFQSIRIRGADLSQAVCHGTDFQGADLTDVKLAYAWLQEANFEDACMRGTIFGELPRIENEHIITTMCIDPKGRWLYTGDIKGYVTQWFLPSNQPLRKWYVKEASIPGKLMTSFGGNRLAGLITNHEGSWLALASISSVVILGDMLGKQNKQITIALKEDITSNHGEINRIQFCLAQDQGLIFGCYSTGLEMWDIPNKQRICRFVYDDSAIYEKVSAENISVHSDGNILAWYVDSWGGTIYRESGKLLIFTQLNKQEEIKYPDKSQIIPNVNEIIFSPDGQWLALGKDSEIQLLTTTNWTKLKSLHLGDSSIQSLTFSPDRSLIATSSWHSENINLLDVTLGKYIGELALPAATGIIASDTNYGSRVAVKEIFFLPSLEKRLLYKCNDNIVQAQLIQMNPYLRSRYYPLTLQWVPQGIIKDSIFDVTIEQDNLKINLEIGKNKGTLTIHQPLQPEKKIEFKALTSASFGYLNDHQISLLLSPNTRYIAFAFLNNNAFFLTLPIANLAKNLGPFFLKFDATIKVYDREKEQLHIFKHSNQIGSMIFSADSKWLITAGFTVRIWSLTSGRCVQVYDQHERWADTIALSADKQFLAIADGGCFLSIWNTKYYYCLNKQYLSVRIRKMLFSSDSTYLMCYSEPNKELLRFSKNKRIDEFLFRFQLTEGILKASVVLVNRTAPLSLNNHGAKLTNVMGLSDSNQCLLRQGGAVGSCAQLSEEDISMRFDITKPTDNLVFLEHALQFDRPIIKQYTRSQLYTRLPIDYNNWVISLLRDPQSKGNDYHTFIVVEGMNAFGRILLYRYDLATRVGNQEVEPGYAKVIISQQSGILFELHRQALNDLLNPKQERRRGIDSVVGYAWSITRQQAQQLHRAVKKDEEKGTIMYNVLGNAPITSNEERHNCYTWAREKLLSLGNKNINKILPISILDYIVVNPKFHLKLTPDQAIDQPRQSCLIS